MWRSVSPITLAVLIAAIVSGCRHADSNSVVTAPHKETKSASRAGWVDVSSSGFTLSLPADMKVKDLNQGDVNVMMDRIKQKRPGEDRIANALKRDAAKGDLKLVAAMKQASAEGFHNSIAVLVKPNSGTKTEDEILSSNVAAIEKISEPGSVIGNKVSLPCGSAIRIQSARKRSGGATTATTSYLILHDQKMYVFSFASRKGDQDEWRQIAQAEMESLKYDP